MKKILTGLVLVVAAMSVKAQQRPQYTMYMVNPFIINPAVAGAENYVDIRAGYRTQWTGFDGAPETFYLSAHAPIGKAQCVNPRQRTGAFGYHGVGGAVMHDVTGPTRRTYSSLSYAYHMKFSDDLFVSIGASGGIQNYQLDPNQLDIYTRGNDVEPGFQQSHTVPEVTVGTWIYGNNFFAGATMSQVGGLDIDLVDDSEEQGRLNHHYFLMGGYKFDVNPDLAILPSTMVKIVGNAPVSVDLNVKARWQNMVWAGLSYRHTDAVSALVGYIWQIPTKNRRRQHHFLDISYAFDLTFSELRKYNSGTHEIVVGYRLPLPTALVCPSHYW